MRRSERPAGIAADFTAGKGCWRRRRRVTPHFSVALLLHTETAEDQFIRVWRCNPQSPSKRTTRIETVVLAVLYHCRQPFAILRGDADYAGNRLFFGTRLLFPPDAT